MDCEHDDDGGRGATLHRHADQSANEPLVPRADQVEARCSAPSCSVLLVVVQVAPLEAQALPSSFLIAAWAPGTCSVVGRLKLEK